jgi:ATP synthase protein I
MQAKSIVYRVVGGQILIGLIATLLAYLLSGSSAASSAALGGVIAVAGNLYFGLQLFAGAPVKPAKEILRRFYVAEVVKTVLTATLFVIAVLVLNASFFPLIVTYAMTLLVYWLALLPLASRVPRDAKGPA